MNIDKAMEELQKYAEDFTKVGDAKLAIKKDKDEFIHKFAKVMQYYRYIEKNVELLSEDWFEAVEIVGDMLFNNPSLQQWVDIILESKPEKTQTQSQSKDTVDPATISGPIESLVSEVKNMQSWDPDHIGDIEWGLQKYRNELISNSNLFDQNAFQSLINDIDASLAKIERFNKMINSDLMNDRIM